jgi:hypothetical protein
MVAALLPDPLWDLVEAFLPIPARKWAMAGPSMTRKSVD